MSNEEIQFEEWLKEAMEHGLISEYRSQEPTFDLLPKQVVKVVKLLKTKTKLVDRFLCAPHTYTPDFVFTMTGKGVLLLRKAFEPSTLTSHFAETFMIYADTKGGYTVQHGQSQVFSCNQKIVYSKTGIWVKKVVPWQSEGKCLFKETWCPESLRWMQARKEPTLNVMGRKTRTIKEFMG